MNKALEAAIIRARSDDNFAVYADWLIEQGDLRGELCARQAKDVDHAFLWEHREYFYGPFAPYAAEKPQMYDEKAIEPRWRYGWLDGVVLGTVNDWASDEVEALDYVEKLIEMLPKCDSARFLRELVISRPVAEGEYNFGAAITAIAKVMPQLPCLRRLEIGRFTANDSELSWAFMGKLAEIWPHAKRLEYLKLRAGEMDLRGIDLPACTEFAVETSRLSIESFHAIAKASWPQLESLSLWLGAYTVNADQVQAILDVERFPRIEHLALKNFSFGDELAPFIVKSKLLPRLRTLDVSMSHLTAVGLLVYEESEALGHLEHLDLSECLLDEEAQEIAAGLAKRVSLADQHDPDGYAGGDRYVAVFE